MVRSKAVAIAEVIKRLKRIHATYFAAMLFALAGCAFSNAEAAQDDELLELINQYRAGGTRCAGRSVAPAAALRANAKLAAAARTAADDGPLGKHLQREGYSANNAQWLNVTGTESPLLTMKLLAQRFCGQLTRASYTDIGIYQNGASWSIVLAAPRSGPTDAAAAAKKILALTNSARGQARRCGKTDYSKAQPLSWNAQLAAAATQHSADMASKNYFSHTAENGSTPDERVKHAGYRYRIVAENIAAGQADAREVVTGWLKSPGHCANVMNPKVTEMGAGVRSESASKLGIYWTQVFARPL